MQPGIPEISGGLKRGSDDEPQADPAGHVIEPVSVETGATEAKSVLDAANSKKNPRGLGMGAAREKRRWRLGQFIGGSIEGFKSCR